MQLYAHSLLQPLWLDVGFTPVLMRTIPCLCWCQVAKANFWAEGIMQQVWRLQECRAKSLGAATLTPNQFLIRFAVNNVCTVLDLLCNPRSTDRCPRSHRVGIVGGF